MPERPKLLFVSPCTPDPCGTGWEQRAFSFLTAYAKFADVDLWFQPTKDHADLRRLGPAIRLCDTITAFYPQLLNDLRPDIRHSFLHQISASHIVHVFRLPELVAQIRHPRLVWDIDELPWQASPAARHGDNSQAPASHRQFDAEFLDCFRHCRMVFACSYLEKPAQAEITVIPNVVAEPVSAVTTHPASEADLLFVGNFNYEPNLDGLLFFSKFVLPNIASHLSGLTIKAVGRSPQTKQRMSVVKALQDSGRFRFIFDVPDCAPYYAQAPASIVPIRTGGGTRIKIIEAFAHQCPVVSTRKGCEGLEVAHDRELLIADTPQEFASACLRLLSDAALRKTLTDNASGLFRQRYSQNVVDELLASTVGRIR